MKRFLISSISVIVLVSSLFAAGSKELQTTENDKALRIVSLAPNVTETVAALGAENLLVGRTDYCNYPESVKDIPSIGTLWNPSIETIIALKPDIVIASSLIDGAILSSLEKAGINVASLNKQQTFDGTYDFIREIGDLIGKEQEAETVVVSMKASVEKTRKSVEPLSSPTVYLAVSFGAMDSTATGDTFIGGMLALAGGKNVAGNATGWLFSKEELVQADPDVLILMREEGKTDEETIQDWKTTSPYKTLRGKVSVIDADLVSRQGPRSAEALSALAEIIHR